MTLTLLRSSEHFLLQSQFHCDDRIECDDRIDCDDRINCDDRIECDDEKSKPFSLPVGQAEASNAPFVFCFFLFLFVFFLFFFFLFPSNSGTSLAVIIFGSSDASLSFPQQEKQQEKQQKSHLLYRRLFRVCSDSHDFSFEASDRDSSGC